MSAPPPTGTCKSRSTLALANLMFNDGNTTSPFAMSCGTTALTVSIGIANPTPADVPVGVKMAVLMPMSCPRESKSGPPLFPGLIAASVWIAPVIKLPTCD